MDRLSRDLRYHMTGIEVSHEVRDHHPVGQLHSCAFFLPADGS